MTDLWLGFITLLEKVGIHDPLTVIHGLGQIDFLLHQLVELTRDSFHLGYKASYHVANFTRILAKSIKLSPSSIHPLS